MVNFSIVRKGYDVKQVDTYVNKIVSFTESKLLDQKNRIDSLKEENRQLEEKIKDYEKQSTIVSEALISATKKANEIINASKMRFALESERIKIFRAKWTSYVENSMNKVYELDESVNMQAYLTKMEDEIRESIGKDLNIHKARIINDAEEQFMSERGRLNNYEKNDLLNEMTDSVLKNETNADKEEDYIEKVKEAITSNVKQAIVDNNYGDDEDSNDEFLSEFNTSQEIELNEALNPKRSLQDICRELGLVTD